MLDLVLSLTCSQQLLHLLPPAPHPALVFFLFFFNSLFPLLAPQLNRDLLLGPEPLWISALLHLCTKSRDQGHPSGSLCRTMLCQLLPHWQPGNVARQTCAAPSRRALPPEDKSKSPIKFTGMLAPITFPITLFFPSYYFFSPLPSTPPPPPPYFILGASESSTVA